MMGRIFGKEGKTFARLNADNLFETIKEASNRIAEVFAK